MTQEQLIEKLQRDLEFEKGQFEDMYKDFCFYRERVAELTGEHAVLEKAFHALEQEHEQLKADYEELRATLIRERRAHAQGDSLSFLKWKTIEVKKQDMVLVTGHKKGAKNIIIPEVIEGLPVLGVEEEAFADCETLETVDIPDGVRAVADRAFVRCPKLQTVRIPKSVVWMGEDTFFGSLQTAFICEEKSYAYWYAKEKGHQIILPEEDV